MTDIKIGKVFGFILVSAVPVKDGNIDLQAKNIFYKMALYVCVKAFKVYQIFKKDAQIPFHILYEANV